MRVIPWIAKKRLQLFFVNALIFGVGLDYFSGNAIDYWIHDVAVVFQAREEWRHTGIIALDDGVPMHVSRIQALPLYARAANQLHKSGVKGIFFDAKLIKENESAMPYAECIEPSGEARMSKPLCTISTNQCQINSSALGNAPLKMNREVFSLFRIAPYVESQADYPDALLYDWDNLDAIPNGGLNALDRLVKKESGIARWLDLSPEHADMVMSAMLSPEKVHVALTAEHEICDYGLPCQRIRFSKPTYQLQNNLKQPIIALSQLASCDEQIAAQAAKFFSGRIAIMQATMPAEPSDIVVTPMATAPFGPHALLPGAQYLVNAIETLLNEDQPRPPHWIVKITLFTIMAALGVYLGAYLKRLSWLWGIAFLNLLILSALCCLNPIYQLWPVSVSVLTFAIGALQSVALQLLIGLKEGKLITQYMPRQVHNLLLNLESDDTFQNQRYQAVVLMSDLAGYTTITSLINEPSQILNLMNDYLEQTTLVLQEHYEGWLETYIGDMVCFYWPFKSGQETHAYQNSLLGAVELSELQKSFFSKLIERYASEFDTDLLNKLQQIMNAGIGIATGPVVMGDMGPKKGVRKFGILGDPMNLTSRIESLTRLFNTEIIIAEELVATARHLHLPVRRLGCYKVKGRLQPATIYALGAPGDARFEAEQILAWENWLQELEQSTLLQENYPPLFHKDFESLKKWHQRGFLSAGIWNLEDK